MEIPSVICESWQFCRAFGRLLDTSEDVKILMLGLDGAGKTTMLYQMKVGEVISTIPTIGMHYPASLCPRRNAAAARITSYAGFNVESVTYKNLTFTVRAIVVQFTRLVHHRALFIVNSCADVGCWRCAI
jgi:hypothetical protein